MEGGKEPGADVVGAVSQQARRPSDMYSAKSFTDSIAEIKGRKKMWIIILAIVILAIIITVLVFVFLVPPILDLVEDIGDELRKDKSSFGMIFICALGATIFNCVPLPGRIAWNLVIGFVYGWAGFFIMLFGHCVGGIIAFFGARLLWPYFEGCSKRNCCCCFWGELGRPRKPLQFLLACVDEIEERPMRTIFLLCLSPVPLVLMAYVIGAKCVKTSWWQYLIPMASAGFRFVVPTYLGVKADDLKNLITGESQDAVDLLFTIVSVSILIGVFAFISRLAYKRVRDATQGPPPQRKPSKAERIARIGCCLCIIILGIAVFIVNLIILGKLTPLYEPLDLEFLPRSTCVQIQVTGDPTSLPSLMLEIQKIQMIVPLAVYNSNPIDATTTVRGTVFHGNTGVNIGEIFPYTVKLVAVARNWGKSDTPSRSTVDIGLEFPNATVVGLPPAIPVTALLAGASPGAGSPGAGGGGGATTTTNPANSCGTVDTASDAATKQAYIQCMASQCVDSDVVALTGISAATCTFLKYTIGCGVDLSVQYHQLPTGSFVRSYCTNSCNVTGCARRLDFDSLSLPMLESTDVADGADGVSDRHLQALGMMEIPAVAEIKMQGDATFQIVGNIKPKVAIDTTRYLRQTISVDPVEAMKTRLATGSGGMTPMEALLDMMAAPKSLCSTPNKTGGLCADTKELLLGNHSDVMKRPGVRNCEQLGPPKETFDDKNETKWIYCVFFFLLSMICMACGTANIVSSLAKRRKNRGSRADLDAARADNL